jgi:hypothetical protein
MVLTLYRTSFGLSIHLSSDNISYQTLYIVSSVLSIALLLLFIYFSKSIHSNTVLSFYENVRRRYNKLVSFRMVYMTSAPFVTSHRSDM